MPQLVWLSNDGVFHTVQGEGKYVGVPSVFVRLSGCNLRCRWANPDGTYTLCDTPYTSHSPERGTREAVEDVARKVLAHGAKHVVISGGEPYLQKAGLAGLIHAIKDLHPLQHITVETNGTLWHETGADFVSISPKLLGSVANVPGVDTTCDIHRDDTLAATATLIESHFESQVKFVVNAEADLAEVDQFCEALTAKCPDFEPSSVYLMPQGITASQLDERLPFIIDHAKRRGFNVTDRLHIRVWGHKRAV